MTIDVHAHADAESVGDVVFIVIERRVDLQQSSLTQNKNQNTRLHSAVLPPDVQGHLVSVIPWWQEE